MKPWLILAIVVALGAAWMFRYEVVQSPTQQEVWLWDRWLHRAATEPR